MGVWLWRHRTKLVPSFRAGICSTILKVVTFPPCPRVSSRWRPLVCGRRTVVARRTDAMVTYQRGQLSPLSENGATPARCFFTHQMTSLEWNRTLLPRLPTNEGDVLPIPGDLTFCFLFQFMLESGGGGVRSPSPYH